jgi:hypothetical protein
MLPCNTASKASGKPILSSDGTYYIGPDGKMDLKTGDEVYVGAHSMSALCIHLLLLLRLLPLPSLLLLLLLIRWRCCLLLLLMR